MVDTTITIGPPGTGKTTRLLDILERELEHTDPNRIAFVSFTRRAVQEAMDRAMDRFGFSKDDLPWFRTLHSLAFQRLGLTRDEVMQGKHYREIGDHLGLVFGTKQDIEEGLPTSRFTGDRYTFLDGYARAKFLSPEDAWNHCAGEGDELNWWEFRRFRKVLAEYKAERGLLDFTDMLEQTAAPLDVDLVIIDEAQDLSTLQWVYANYILLRAPRIHIAGDDDQAIFQWSGADVGAFQALTGRREVLEQSHRVPKAIHTIAERVASNITVRTPKQYRPRDIDGSIEYHMSPDDVDLSVPGTWLLLARNIHLLPQLVAICRAQGINYSFRGEPAVNHDHIRAIQLHEARRGGKELTRDETAQADEFRCGSVDAIWHESLTKISRDDREWYISMLRRGEKINKQPRVSIQTIHGVKGAEADNVMLLTDMSARSFRGYQDDPDGEHRVWYVGATRTRENLHIVQSQGRMGYDI